MIPYIIHYCWFGKKKKPKEVEEYIASWKRLLPEFQIIEWNEDNFCVDELLYTKQAYEKEKYAFVSDVARLKALYEMGGVYLDTDIEIKKDLSKLLDKHKLILGYEDGGNHLMTAFIAANQYNEVIGELLNQYNTEMFIIDNDELNVYPNTYRLTELLKNKGIVMDGAYKVIGDGQVIYPEKSFSAMEFKTMTEISDDTTYTVHHFKSSWKPWYVRLRRKIKFFLIGILKKVKFI